MPDVVKTALTKFFKMPQNRSASLRAHELMKLMNGNPLSIKMLASLLKNSDSGSSGLRDLYEKVKQQSMESFDGKSVLSSHTDLLQTSLAPLMLAT